MSNDRRSQVLFVQGAGDMSAPEGSGVLASYLRDSLGNSFVVTAPLMPDAAIGPRYAPWRDEIEAALGSIGDPVLMVGHSVGASVVLKYLSEGPPAAPVAGLFLVSTPWWGMEGWGYDEYGLSDDFASRLPAVPTFLYHSKNDPHVPSTHLDIYLSKLPQATSRLVKGSEHSFLHGLPALLEDIRAVAAK